MSTYNFDALKFGYEPLSNFPELDTNWWGDSTNTYIKITILGGEEFKPIGRVVYWYTAIKFSRLDDRLTIYSHSYDSHTKENFSQFNSPRTVYNGLISNDDFAKELLKHIMSTTRNSSVETHGKERLERIIKIDKNEK